MRTYLTSDLNLSVDPINGNDATALSQMPFPTTPFLNPQTAVDQALSQYDCPVKTKININLVANDNWPITSPITIAGPLTGGGQLWINGAMANPGPTEGTILTGVAANSHLFIVLDGGKLWLQNLGVITENAHCLIAGPQAELNFGGISFYGSPGGLSCYVTRQSYMEMITPCAIYGGGAGWLQSSHQGNFRCQIAGYVITFEADCQYTAPFAYSSSLADITFTGGNVINPNNFTVTGQRYAVDENAIIQILQSTGSTFFFPGDISGSEATGGQYIF